MINAKDTIKIFINHDKLIPIEICPIISTFHLKQKLSNKLNYPIDNLFYKGKVLDDNKSLLELNVNNNDILYISNNLKGGFANYDSFSLLLLSLYINAIIIYCILLFSGILPLIAFTYDYLLNVGLKWFMDYTGLSANTPVMVIVWIFLIIFRISAVFILLYIMTSFIVFPLIYYFKDESCPSIILSKKFGFIIALAYIIIYGLFSIPDELSSFLIYTTNISPISKAVISPFIRNIQNITDEVKFSGFFAIPYLGTPFLSGYFFGIDILTGVLDDILGIIADFSCDDKQSINTLAKTIINYRAIPPLFQYVQNNNLEYAFDILPIALMPKVNEYYKCELEKLPFWEKYSPFNEFSAKYYASNMVFKGLCFALTLVRKLTDIIYNIGGTEVIANYIKTGCISGLITIILAPLITLIMWFSGYF